MRQREIIWNVTPVITKDCFSNAGFYGGIDALQTYCVLFGLSMQSSNTFIFIIKRKTALNIITHWINLHITQLNTVPSIHHPLKLQMFVWIRHHQTDLQFTLLHVVVGTVIVVTAVVVYREADEKLVLATKNCK